MTAPPVSPTRPKRRRRWVWISLLAIVGVFVLIFVAGEIIFATGLPRDLVISEVESQLGVRVSVQSLSTGWMGHTSLEQVSLTLPLAKQPFLTVGEIRLKHTNLPWFLMTRTMRIEDISCDHAELRIDRDAQGRWNFQEVAQVVSRQGIGQPDTGQKKSIPQIPALHLSEATVIVDYPGAKPVTIDHLNVNGQPNGTLVWECDAEVPDRLKITGRIAPGGIWAHEADVTLNNSAGSESWLKSLPSNAKLQATWDGQINNGGLMARLNVRELNYNHISASGLAGIFFGSGQGVVEPAGLSVKQGNYAAVLNDGKIQINTDGLNVQQLGVQLFGGEANVSGKMTFADQAISAQAQWRDVAFPASIRQTGDLSIDFARRLAEPRFTLQLNSRGEFSSGHWTARADVDGHGGWNTLSVTAGFSQLMVQTNGGKTVDFSGLSATLADAGNGMLSLQKINLGKAAPISGSGGYDRNRKVAWLSLDARAWPIPGASRHQLDADLNIWSDLQRFHLQQLYLETGPFSAWGEGDYVFSLPKPVSARCWIMTPEAAANPVGQNVHSEFDLSGTVVPIDLAISGKASGTNLAVKGRQVGDMKFAFAGTVHGEQENLLRVDVESKDIQLFGGTWTVDGHWPVRDSLMRFDNISVLGLSLQKVFDRPDVSGTMDGKWSVDIQKFERDGIKINGSALAKDVAFGNKFQAATIDVQDMQLNYGDVRAGPVEIVHDANGGKATVFAWANLADLSQIHASIDATQWPVEIPGNKDWSCNMSARGQGTIEPKTKAVYGDVDWQAALAEEGKPAVQLAMSTELLGRRVEAGQIAINALGSSAKGDAFYDVDLPMTSHGVLTWTAMNLGELQNFSPRWKDVAGQVDGVVEVHPATTPRPLEPLAFAIHLTPHSVHLDQVQVGTLQSYGFIGTGRVVLDNSPGRQTQVAFAGGTIGAWGRLSRHEGNLNQGILQVTLHDLNLDAVIPKGSKVARTPGVVNGNVTLIASPGSGRPASGDGEIQLSKSDLAGTGPISFLYNLMHVGHDPNKPRGNGSVDFTFHGQTVQIMGARYFDRGREVRGSGHIDDILQIPHCPLLIAVVGSLRPFSSIHLPGLSDIDAALSSIQRDSLTIRIHGYLDKLNDHGAYSVITFSAISDDLKNMLLLDVQSSHEQPSE